MKINGNLQFHLPTGAGTDGQITNAVIERLVGGVAGATLPETGDVAGRIVYNTTENLYYFHNGTDWTPFSTGGSATGIQAELDLTQAATGYHDTDGTFNPTLLNALGNITGLTTGNTLVNALTQLDTAISNAADVDTLAELTDVTLGTPAAKEVLYYSGSAWVDQALVTTDITGVTVSAAEINRTTGLTTNIATITGNLQTFTGSTGDTDTAPAYANNEYIVDGDTLIEAIDKLDAQIKLNATALTTIDLDDLADVTDVLTKVVDDSYFFTGDTTSSLTTLAATLGAINNVAAAVDSATTEDVLAYDGSAWTAITPVTFAAEIDIDDIGDVTVTTPALGDILVYNTTGTVWENKTFAAAGVQPLDAGLTALAGAGVGLVSMNGDTVAFRTLVESTTTALTITNGTGVSGNPSIAIDATLDGLAALAASTADKMIYTTGVDAFAYSTVTTAGLALIDDASAAAQRTTLAVYSTTEADTNFVDADGDTMSGTLIIPTGQVIQIADNPSTGTDAANKAYVDAQAGGLTWLDPVWYVDMVHDEVGIDQIKDYQGATSTTIVADAETTDMYISNAAALEFTAIGSTGNSVTLNTGGTGTAGAMGPGDVVRFNDDAANSNVDPYWEYIGHTSDVGIFPTNAYYGICTVTGATAGGTFATNEGYIYQMTGNGTAGNNNSVWAVHPTHAASGPSDTETFLVNNPNSGNAFKQFTFVGTYAQAAYPGATSNKWLQSNASSAIVDGIGLSFSGNILNVNLGAGIIELPGDEVGLDVETGKGVQLTSTATGGLLTLVLDGSTLTQSASGLKLADLTDGRVLIGNGSNVATGVAVTGDVTITNLGVTSIGADKVTEAMFAGSQTAADILLVNTSGDPIYQTVTGDVTITNTGVTAIGTDKVLNAMILNDHISTSSDGGGGSDISLGGTLTISGGQSITTSQSGAVFTVAADTATASTLGVAKFNTANFLVIAGDVTIKDGGVALAELAADANHIGVTADDNSSDVALGSNISIVGTTESATQFGVATANTAGSVAITVTGGLNALDDVVIASDASGDILVSDGTDYDNKPISMVSTQASAASWTVTHNLGQQFVNVTVYDGSNQVIIPQSITATSANVTTITFNTALAGTAVIMGVAGSATESV